MHKTRCPYKHHYSSVSRRKLLPNTLAVFTDTLKQKYKLEIIVSDGGSTDSTLAIAKGSADIIVCHTENRRQTIAEGRNMGSLVANGDIMVFLNADTIPANPEEFLETLKNGKIKCISHVLSLVRYKLIRKKKICRYNLCFYS